MQVLRRLFALFSAFLRRIGENSIAIATKSSNRVDVGSYPQHLSLHRTYGSRIRRYIHIGERKL